MATLVVALWLVWRLRGGEDRGRALLVAAAATVLANPHMHVQDLVVLALPAAVLLVARRGWLDVAVPALFVPLPAVALTGLNLMTPLLAGLLCYLALEEAGVARRLATGWQLARRVKWQGGRPVLVPARA
ncbi:MAG: hypothetical protein HYS09_10140 [Chloroflexi bacterium]|nr:hypothetical protein [Chloroflexota bacterium]